MTDQRPRDDLVIGEHYYILASSVAADLPKLVLKHDSAFLVADRRGDLPNIPGEFGFYVNDTRFLSLFELRLHGQRGLMLNAGLSDDALEAAVDLTNPDVSLNPMVVLPGRSTRLLRRLTILGGQLYQWLAIEGFVADRYDLELTLGFAADFVDVFEVRGHPRPRRGELLAPRVDGKTVRLGYRELDALSWRERDAIFRAVGREGRRRRVEGEGCRAHDNPRLRPAAGVPLGRQRGISHHARATRARRARGRRHRRPGDDVIAETARIP
jgi:hypothetical protein